MQLTVGGQHNLGLFEVIVIGAAKLVTQNVLVLKGQRVGNPHPQPPQVSSFVVFSNEATIDIEGIRCNALIDTGYMISTISESFAHIAKLTVLPLQDLIRIEGARGHHI